MLTRVQTLNQHFYRRADVWILHSCLSEVIAFRVVNNNYRYDWLLNGFCAKENIGRMNSISFTLAGSETKNVVTALFVIVRWFINEWYWLFSFYDGAVCNKGTSRIPSLVNQEQILIDIKNGCTVVQEMLRSENLSMTLLCDTREPQTSEENRQGNNILLKFFKVN